MKVDTEHMIKSVEGIMALHDPECPEISDAKYMYENLEALMNYLKGKNNERISRSGAEKAA